MKKGVHQLDSIGCQFEFHVDDVTRQIALRLYIQNTCMFYVYATFCRILIQK